MTEPPLNLMKNMNIGGRKQEELQEKENNKGYRKRNETENWKNREINETRN